MSEQALSMAAWAVVAATISGDVTPRCRRDGQDQPNRDMAAKRTIEFSARRGRHWRHRASAKAGTDLGGKQEKRITTRNKTKIDCSAGRSTNPTEFNTAVLVSRLRRQHKAEPALRAGEELCRGPQSSRSHFCGDEASQGFAGKPRWTGNVEGRDSDHGTKASHNNHATKHGPKLVFPRRKIPILLNLLGCLRPGPIPPQKKHP